MTSIPAFGLNRFDYTSAPAFAADARRAESLGPVEELKKQVWPDFHHAEDLEASGRLVSFLPDAVADAFSLYGTPEMIARQLCGVLSLGFPIEMIIPHPVPTPPPGGPRPDYIERFASEVIPLLQAEMGHLR